MAMKNKTFLNKLKASVQIDIEKQLLPRLKVMSYLLFGFAIATFLFALLAPKEASDSPDIMQEETAGVALFNDDTPFELDPREVLNFYSVAAIFACTGASLLLIHWKKAKQFK